MVSVRIVANVEFSYSTCHIGLVLREQNYDKKTSTMTIFEIPKLIKNNFIEFSNIINANNVAILLLLVFVAEFNAIRSKEENLGY